MIEFIEFKKCFSIFKINNKRAQASDNFTKKRSSWVRGFNWGL
ncbi:hypothetical protein HMPREF1420_00721 [Helicobacter pylori GAM264Ai]|nr:hypothetical protein HMPREF1420_00721 [Helicobacter pylori GAM264Ai]